MFFGEEVNALFPLDFTEIFFTSISSFSKIPSQTFTAFM